MNALLLMKESYENMNDLRLQQNLFIDDTFIKCNIDFNIFGKEINDTLAFIMNYENKIVLFNTSTTNNPEDGYHVKVIFV